jgi:hypothetical protein
MSRFKGKNTIGSPTRLFAERVNYHLDAYRNFSNIDHVRDMTFGEFQMYGRINHNSLPVIPNEEFMVSISPERDQDTDYRALDFVVEAFEDVKIAFKNACLLNAIPQEDPFLSVIQVAKAYESPIELYSNYMEDLFKTFHETYLLEQNLRSQVLSLSDYTDHIVKYLSILSSTFPMTFSSWQKSKESSIFTSGIAISIADLRIDDDAVKFSNFLSNPIFTYYLNVAKQHGFNVVKNSPWVLFADLDSRVMKDKQLQKRLIVSTGQLFNSRFTHAHRQDISLLDEIIIRNYNKFVELFPIEKKYNICNNNKLIYNIINRNKNNSIEDKLTPYQIASIYCNMKNIEENHVFAKQDLNIIIKNAKNFIKSFDRRRGINYINEKFRQTFKSKPGGINSVIRRNKAYEDSLLED